VVGLRILGAIFFMRKFKIKSPLGKELIVTAENIFHACQKAVEIENYKFSNVEYLKLNK